VQPSAAFLRSASFKTIALALPPSSISTGFRCLPAVLAMMLPTAVLPVKLIFLTDGWAMMAFVTAAASSGRWYSRFRTPAGRPPSRKQSAMAQ
jgi:hypothetical protein